MSDITCKLVNVTIERGRDVLSVDVPKHEIAVLRVVHGGANVTEGDVTDDEIDLPDSADGEFMRLQGKYRRVNSPDPVGAAFRIGPPALEEFGFKLGRRVDQAPAQSGSYKGEKPKKKADKADK